MSFLEVTEISGEEVPREQIERMCHRYYWAADFCRKKDVLELACGTGQGLGLISEKADFFMAADLTAEVLNIAQRQYGETMRLTRFNAQCMPIIDNCMDVVVLFEAIYYLLHIDQFIIESRRILRDGGKVLIATANKDLYDFNPSPYSVRYYGVPELKALFEKHGFSVQCFGHLSVEAVSWRQRVLRPIKKLAAQFGLIPKTMKGKMLLKRLVFGKLTPMPAVIREGMAPFEIPENLDMNHPDRKHKVIYCVATCRKRRNLKDG